MKRKNEYKLKGIEVSCDYLEELEEDIIADVEEIVQDKFAPFRDNLEKEEEYTNNTYKTQYFYWGGEKCDEMIYFDV